VPVTYVALLRGIGPGNPNMRNERFIEVLEGLGFSDVRTVLSTGNVVFQADEADGRALEDRIEPAWPERLGFRSTTIVRSFDEIAALVADDPFGGVPHGPSSYQLVTFVKQRPPPRLEHREPGFEVVGVHERSGAVLTLTDQTGSGATDVMSWLDKQLGKEISSRTSLTVSRILRKMESLG
jgi:uncharacterized protein (DUF1697 family)